MDVMTKARELGEAIQETEQFKNLQNTEAAYQADEEAQNLTEAYNALRGELAQKAQSDDITPQEMLDIRQTISREFGKLAENPVIKAYIDAKKEFEDVMGQVDGIIKYYITGEEPGCGGSCSSCAGCH